MRIMKVIVGLFLATCSVGAVLAFGDMLFWLSWKGWLGLAAYSTMVFALSHWLNRFSARFERPERIVWLMIASCCLAGICTALVFDFGYHLAMVSDFASAQRAIEAGKPMVLHPGWCEYWCNYELLLSYLGMAFVPHVLSAQFLNVLCMSAAVYPVFMLSRKNCGMRAAIVVSMAMALSPALMAYSAFTTGEFIGMVFMTYAYYVMSEFPVGFSSWRSALFRILTCGVLLGVSQMFKPLALIFFAALLAKLILLIFARRVNVRCRLFWGVLALLAVFACYKVSLYCYRTAFTSMNTTGNRIEAISESPWKGLVVGLNIASDGTWEQSISDLAHKSTHDEARVFVVNRAKKEWKGYPKLVLKKFVRLYQSENWLKAWCREALPTDADGAFFSLADGAFAFMSVLFLSGLVGMILLNRKASDGESGTAEIDYLPLLAVAGFTAVIMLIEMQPRYRISIYPFYFMVMSYAKITYDKLLALVKKFLER